MYIPSRYFKYIHNSKEKAKHYSETRIWFWKESVYDPNGVR